MDGIRIGLSVRALRIRRGWRQLDVAMRAGVSRGTISNAERGLIGRLSIDTLVRIAAVLGADVDVRIRWRGEGLDRLLDEGHATLVDAMAARLHHDGWETALEVTFSIRGERGSIDILAFHARSRALLVVEVKTVVPDFQAMVSALDRKTRLGPVIARDHGWSAGSTSRLLVIEAGSTSRGRVERLGAATASAFPDRGARVRSWLRAPDDPVSGLLFVRSAIPGDVTRRTTGRQRVRPTGSGRNATTGGVSGDSTWLKGPPRA